VIGAVFEMRTSRPHFANAISERAPKIDFWSPDVAVAVSGDCEKLKRNTALWRHHMSPAAASHTSSFFGLMPMVAFVLVGLTLYRWNRRNKTVNHRRMDQMLSDLETIKRQVLLVSTDLPPSRTAIRTIGYLESVSAVEAASDADYRLAECDALLSLARNARAQGANAIVGLRKAHAHYDQPGSQWRVSRVIYSGTAVTIQYQFRS
jgi:hypothetical protein